MAFIVAISKRLQRVFIDAFALNPALATTVWATLTGGIRRLTWLLAL
jgi:hypothetical protein